MAAPEEALENWPWPFRVYTLGRFAVLKDGDPMDFTGKASRKPLELLKAVIALGGEEVSKDALIDALWPELEGDHAARSFETALYRLRKLLGDETILVLKDRKLTLDERYAWIDVSAIDGLLKRLEAALTSSGMPGTVFVGPLDDAEASGAALVLFLYRIVPNANLRNREHRPPSSVAPPTVYQNSLPLDLYFLITVGTTSEANEETPLRWLGYAIQAIQSAPDSWNWAEDFPTRPLVRFSSSLPDGSRSRQMGITFSRPRASPCTARRRPRGGAWWPACSCPDICSIRRPRSGPNSSISLCS